MTAVSATTRSKRDQHSALLGRAAAIVCDLTHGTQFAVELARVLALGLLLTGCEPEPWHTSPPNVEPSQQCRTGREQGYDVYVWHCHEGQRIAIFRRCSALMGCTAGERQSGGLRLSDSHRAGAEAHRALRSRSRKRALDGARTRD